MLIKWEFITLINVTVTERTNINMSGRANAMVSLCHIVLSVSETLSPDGVDGERERARERLRGEGSRPEYILPVRGKWKVLRRSGYTVE